MTQPNMPDEWEKFAEKIELEHRRNIVGALLIGILIGYVITTLFIYFS